MTNVERFCNVARLVAEINPELNVTAVLEKAAQLVSLAGPQPRVRTKPARVTKKDKDTAAA